MDTPAGYWGDFNFVFNTYLDRSRNPANLTNQERLLIYEEV